MRTWPDSGLGGIAVIGINSKDTNVASANATITRNSVIPWLQDTAGAAIWDAAKAEKDDIYILDSHHKIVRYFSCYTYDLAAGAGRDTLRTWLRQVAGVSMLSNGEPPARRGSETRAADAASSSQISPRR